METMLFSRQRVGTILQMLHIFNILSWPSCDILPSPTSRTNLSALASRVNITNGQYHIALCSHRTRCPTSGRYSSRVASHERSIFQTRRKRAVYHSRHQVFVNVCPVRKIPNTITHYLVSQHIIAYASLPKMRKYARTSFTWASCRSSTGRKPPSRSAPSV